MLIHMIRTTNSPLGHDFKFGQEYEVSEAYGKRTILRGHAVPAEDVLIEKLAKHGGGLLVTPQTSKGLIRAARARGIVMGKAVPKVN